MQKRILGYVIVLMVLMTPAAWAGSEEEANRLFTDAGQWAAAAQKTEGTSYTGALELNEKALNALERIVREYGKTTLAAKLVKGEAKIGNVTYAEFRERVLRSRKNRDWAEGNAFGTALLMAKQVPNAQEQRELVAEVLQEYWNYTSQPTEEILSVAFETAQSIREPRRKLQTLLQIAEKAAADSPIMAAVLREAERETYTDAELLIITADLYAWGKKYNPMLDRLRQAAKRTKDPLLTRRIAKGLAVAKQYDDAAEMAKKYGTLSEKDDALLGVIAQAAENGDYAKAAALLDQLERVQEKQSGWIYIAVGYSGNGDLPGALRLLHNLERSEGQMEMLHEIGFFYTSGVTSEMLRQIDALPDPVMRVQVLCALFENYYYRMNAESEAAAVLHRCYELMKSSRVYEENPGLIGVLTQDFGLLRQSAMMLECYTLSLRTLGTNPTEAQIETWIELMGNCSEYLTPEMFLQLLEPTVKYTSESLRGVTARRVLNVAGQYYQKMGQPSRGLQTVKGVLDRPTEPGAEEAVADLAVTAGRCLLDLGDAKKAGEMARQAYELTRRISGYAGMRALFELFCDLGEYERVREWMTQVREDDSFYLTWADDLLRTAEGCSRWNRGEQAVKIIEEMLAQRPDKGDPERSEILGGLAGEYAKRKDYTRVRQILGELQNEDTIALSLTRLTAMGLQNADDKLLNLTIEAARKMSVAGCGQTLSEMTDLYAAKGRLDQAFTLAEMIRDPQSKSHTFIRLGIACAEKGKAADEAAKKHLRKILNGE